MESILIKFAHDTKVGGVANTLEERIEIQRNLINQAIENKVKLTTDKCKIAHKEEETCINI